MSGLSLLYNGRVALNVSVAIILASPKSCDTASYA